MIGCVLLANTTDIKFLEKSLKELNKINKISKINICVGTKLWDQITEENTTLFDKFENEYTKIIKYNVEENSKLKQKKLITPEMYWEAHARYVGSINFIDCEYILYLDADEIVDGELFNKWCNTKEYKLYDVMKFKNYWYWREPIYRAKNYYEDSILMAKIKYIPFLFSNLGRHGLYLSCEGNKKRNIGTEPMFHHYSWVRTKEEMIKKVTSWGHRNDRKWIDLIEEEFSRPFNGTDFLNGNMYEIIRI